MYSFSKRSSNVKCRHHSVFGRTGIINTMLRTSLVAQTVKASAYNARDPGSIPGLGRSPGDGNVNPFQYSCLEKPMDGGA